MVTQSLASARMHYESDGFYLSSQPVVPADLIGRAIEGMDAIRRGEYETGIPPQPSFWKPGDDPQKLCKIEMPQIVSRAIMELVSHPAIGEIAASLTGAKMVQVWWVQLLMKPAATGEGKSSPSVGWHQDRQYWKAWEEGSELFTAWAALTDVTEEAGPMKFLRGSHRWGLLDQGNFYEANHEAQRQMIRVPEGQAWDEVAALLPPGGVSFHHNLTFHGSGPNVSGKPRRSFAIHMRTEKSRPVNGLRQRLTQFIDDPTHCPVVFGSL